MVPKCYMKSTAGRYTIKMPLAAQTNKPSGFGDDFSTGIRAAIVVRVSLPALSVVTPIRSQAVFPTGELREILVDNTEETRACWGKKRKWYSKTQTE